MRETSAFTRIAQQAKAIFGETVRLGDGAEGGSVGDVPEVFGKVAGVGDDGDAVSESVHETGAASAEAIGIGLEHEIAGNDVVREIQIRQGSGRVNAMAKARDGGD